MKQASALTHERGHASPQIVTSDHKVIARVHSVHLMNVEQRQAAADPENKPPDLDCESACRLLSSTTTIGIYYSVIVPCITDIKSTTGSYNN